MRKYALPLLAVLLALACVPALAQSTSGTIEGRVTDEQGGALPGATVTLVSKTGSRTTTTDAEGGYRFLALDPGQYSVTAELQGFRARRQDGIQVGIGRQASVNLSLGVGQMTETVDVVAEAPVVDVTSSETASNLSSDMLFNMPIRVDNAATDLMNYLPGINNGAAYGGNEDYGSALLLDGVDTRDPDAGSAWTFFNFNIVEEVQVSGLGAPAEYGAYTGAVVNSVTKSGGNQHTGLFDVYYTKDSFYSDNISSEVASANPSLATPAQFRKRLDLNAQMGGPLIKDKLFFFVAAQRFEIDENPSGPRTVRTEVSPRFNAKLSWQPSTNDNLNLTFQYDYYNVTGRPAVTSTLATDALTYRQDSPEAIWGLQWRHLFNSKTFMEVKYTGWWGYYYLDPTVNEPLHLDGTTGLYSGGGGSYYYADRGRHQVNASVSHYAEAFGKHDLKFGVEIERSKVRSRYGFVDNIYYYDYTGYYAPGQYLAYSYGYDSEGRNQRESVFLQDAWHPTERLTINAGVRADFVRGKSPALDNRTIYDNVNIQPRLGFAFDLTGDSKTVLKGSYGQYYEGMYFDAYYTAMPGFQDFVTYAYDPAGSKCGPEGNCFTEIDVSPNPLYTVDPDMKHPRVDEITAGFERALSNDVRFSATGVWRQDKNIQASVFPDARWTPTRVTNGLTGQPLTVYNWANRADSEGNPLLTNVDGFVYRDPAGNALGTARAERKYKALIVALDKRMSNRWMGRISYVYSKSEGTVNNSGAPTYGAASLFETPTNALVNSYGETLNSRPHELKVFGSYQVPKIEVGLNAYYRYLSGRTYSPFQRYSSSQINYPSASQGRQPFIEPRGNRRLESESIVDLRVEKIFSLSDRQRLAVYGDFQNLFNAGTVTAVNARYPNVAVSLEDGSTFPVAFEAPTEIIAPRRMIFGARWTF